MLADCEALSLALADLDGEADTEALCEIDAL
jgi:hypothetical protein